ncbi:MAG TPA: hypothetical protein VGH80_08700 [Xanthomonadaceae bacterium]|jgi:hypothetical protein
MKKLLVACVCACLPLCASAHDAIEGTWKVDLNKGKLPDKPWVYLVKDGMFNCSTCVPAIKVKADGKDQKLAGDPYSDSVAVDVSDPHAIKQTYRKDGKVVSTFAMTVANDGKTASFVETDTSPGNGESLQSKGTDVRVAMGPAGSHAVSGSWKVQSYQSISDDDVTFSIAMKGDELSMSSPTGQSYTAHLGGGDAPYKGDPGTTSVSVRLVGKDAVEETDKRDGKPISVTTMTVSSDGKTLTMVNKDLQRGSTGTYVASKQ